MLNLRTLILSVVLVLTLMLTIPLVTAGTEVASNPSSEAAGVSEIQEQAADLKNEYNAPSYRSQYGECFDVSIRDLAACRDASQALISSYQSPLDECFDVSISEVAGCREASQTTVQSNHSALDECFDVSISEVASCRAASQASTP
jgi:hypothetical protein